MQRRVLHCRNRHRVERSRVVVDEEGLAIREAAEVVIGTSRLAVYLQFRRGVGHCLRDRCLRKRRWHIEQRDSVWKEDARPIVERGEISLTRRQNRREEARETA